MRPFSAHHAATTILPANPRTWELLSIDSNRGKRHRNHTRRRTRARTHSSPRLQEHHQSGALGAALADGRSQLVGVLDSEDTRVMIESLKSLGFKLDTDLVNGALFIEGQGGVIPSNQADLYIANSGTRAHFLAAMVTLGHGKFRMEGTPRMRERPIKI